MADNTETLPGFMASIKASLISLGEKFGMIAEQSARIKTLESDIGTLRSDAEKESSKLKSERDAAIKALIDEQTAHATTRAALVVAEANSSALTSELVEAKSKLADPKFAGNKLAAETLSKLGMKPVPENKEEKPKTLTDKCREAKANGTSTARN